MKQLFFTKYIEDDRVDYFSMYVNKKKDNLCNILPGGMTYVHYACKFGAYKILQYLLKEGGEKVKKLINMKNKRGIAPIFYACQSPDSYMCLSYLIDAGVEINSIMVAGGEKITPLDYEEKLYKNTNSYVLLRIHGAKTYKELIRRK